MSKVIPATPPPDEVATQDEKEKARMVEAVASKHDGATAEAG